MGDFPPGLGYKGSENMTQQNAQQNAQAKRQKTLNELKKSVPGASKGEPVSYDEYGIAQVPDPKAQQQQQKRAEDTFEEARKFMGGERPQGEPEQQQAQAQQAPRHPQPQPVEPFPQVPAHKKTPHPVIQKLLARFGLKKEKRYKLELFTEDSDEPNTYTMTMLTDDLNMWALSETQKKLVTIGDQAIAGYFEHLLVCTSVIAIDGEPAWRIFDVKPESWEAEDLLEDPLDVPARMRKIYALQLSDLLWTSTRPVTDKLIDFYQNKVMEGRKITSSLDTEKQNKMRFVCVRDECDVVEFLEPEHDENGAMKPYYCRTCAAVLAPTTDLQEADNIPLG